MLGAWCDLLQARCVLLVYYVKETSASLPTLLFRCHASPSCCDGHPFEVVLSLGPTRGGRKAVLNRS